MKSYVIALLVVVGVLGGFYGGYKVGQNNVSAASPTTGSSRTGNFTGGAAGGGRGGFGAVCPSPGAPTPAAGSNALARGSITDLTSASMTITNTSCDVKVVYGNTVQVSKNVTGSTSDLQDNITVTIVGTRQPDGTIKATQIQIGAILIGGRGSASPPAGG